MTEYTPFKNISTTALCLFVCVCVCVCVYLYNIYILYKWSEVIHNTQSAQISQKQNGCIYIMSPSA